MRATSLWSRCANVARLSSAHARTNFCGCPVSLSRMATRRSRSRGIHSNSGSARTTWRPISHWSLSASLPMNTPLCGSTQLGCSCASFSKGRGTASRRASLHLALARRAPSHGLGSPGSGTAHAPIARRSGDHLPRAAREAKDLSLSSAPESAYSPKIRVRGRALAVRRAALRPALGTNLHGRGHRPAQLRVFGLCDRAS